MSGLTEWLVIPADRLATGAGADGGERPHVERLPQEPGRAVPERDLHAGEVVAPQVVLKGRGLVDGKRLVEQVGPVDPLHLDPVSVLADEDGRRGAVRYVGDG